MTREPSMAGHFQAVRFHELGNPVDVLTIDDIATSSLAAGEVRIKVEAFALNRADWLYCKGLHYTLPTFPSRIGSECAGIIVQVGTSVNPGLIGRKVCTVPFDNPSNGMQGEYATVPSAYLAPWPEGLTATEAAALWMQYLTAYFALIEIAEIGPSDYILIPAASSSAGLAAVQLAKLRGARVIATSRTATKVQAIRDAGADIVVPLDDKESLASHIARFSGGRGVRVVFDPVAGPFLDKYLDALAENALVFIYGLLSGEQTIIDIVRFVRRAAIIHPYSMFNYVRDPKQLQRGINFIESAVLEGMRPLIDQEFGFDNVINAYRRLDSQSQVGKIVVRVK